MSNFPLRLEPELKAKLQELAKKEKRSLNKTIEHILDMHVNQSFSIVNTPTWIDKFNQEQIEKFIKSRSSEGRR